MGLTRISDRATFAAFRHARRVRSGRIAVSWIPDGSTPPRVAFAIGRTVGGAVTRNRLRRRLRALAQQGDLAPGAWLVSAAPGAGEADWATVAAWWDDAVRAARSEAVPA